MENQHPHSHKQQFNTTVNQLHALIDYADKLLDYAEDIWASSDDSSDFRVNYSLCYKLNNQLQDAQKQFYALYSRMQYIQQEILKLTDGVEFINEYYEELSVLEDNHNDFPSFFEHLDPDFEIEDNLFIETSDLCLESYNPDTQYLVESPDKILEDEI